MLFQIYSSTVLLLLIYHALPTAGSPSYNRKLPSGSSLNLVSHTAANVSSPFDTPSSNDWEHFAHPIPRTKQVLKGRIFRSGPVRPRALHSMLTGGLAQTKQQIYHLGADTRLSIQDNPYTYGVPGCHFVIRSKTWAGRPTMTYGMMRNVFLALEKVLEKRNRNFETSFVLTDLDQVTWGHGAVWEKAPSSLTEES